MGLARSLSNLAKSHAAKGNFDAAVTCWSEAQPNITDRVEQSWLQHEMGRAHLEMGKADEALECGLAAERAANETGDQDWQLHSWILCAQANVALGGHQSALSYYEQAAQLAQRLHKSSLHDAIRQEMVLIEAQASAASVLDEDEDEETDLRTPVPTMLKLRTMRMQMKSRQHKMRLWRTLMPMMRAKTMRALPKWIKCPCNFRCAEPSHLCCASYAWTHHGIICLMFSSLVRWVQRMLSYFIPSASLGRQLWMRLCMLTSNLHKID